MKYGLLITAALLSGCATSPSNMHHVATQELCIDHAQAVLTGAPVATGFLGLMTASAIETELNSRGEQCTPGDAYMQMAEARLQLAAQNKQQAIQAMSTAAQFEQLARPYTLQPAMHSSTTTCGRNGNQVQCQTTGN